METEILEDAVEVGPSAGSSAGQAGLGKAHARPLEFLHGVEMDVSVQLGTTKMKMRDLLEVQIGSIVELDRAAGSPVDVLVNGALIAKGEVVVVDDEFAVRITEVIDATEGGGA